MGAGSSIGMDEKYEQLWEEVKQELDNACGDSMYASEPLFREWFEIVAYWDFANAGGDYDYHIRERDSEQDIWYKKYILEEDHGPFSKLWTYVMNMAEISFSQAGRFRCETPESYSALFENYHTYDRELGVWESDEYEQKFNEFVSMYPVDHIPLAIQHYAEKGACMWCTDSALTDLMYAEC